MTTSNSNPDIVFDYRALRLLMGLVALSLPFVTSLISSSPLPSISASYYTEARDAFVGMSFAIGTLLWAYNGHSPTEKWASKAASLATLFVVVFPTSCDGCVADLKSSIHYVAAVILFGILSYFCLGPFRKNTKEEEGKKGLRGKIYLVCGWIMVLSLLTAGIAQFLIPDKTVKALSVTYWTETIVLIAFGVAWMVAGKYFSPLVDEDEALKLF